MLPIAEVIAHRNVRANLKDLKQPYYEDTPGTPIGLPRITFSDELALHVGGAKCGRTISVAVTRAATRSSIFRSSRSFTPATSSWCCEAAGVRVAPAPHEASWCPHLH